MNGQGGIDKNDDMMTDAVPHHDEALRPYRFTQRSKFTQRAWGMPPWHDLLFNDVLLWLLPTHFTTLFIKFWVVLGVQALGLGRVIYLYRHALDDFHGLLLLATTCLTGSSVMWCYYYRRVWSSWRKLWMRPDVIDLHRLPSHAPLYMLEDERQARQEACRPQPQSNNVHVLHGNMWDFCLFPTAEEALATVQDGNKLDAVHWQHQHPVPSNWTLHANVADHPIYTNQKYPWPCEPPLVPQANPTGMYRRVLDHPWPSTILADYTVTVQGFESCCYIYWNDHFVGMAKDSRLPCEVDVTPYMNTIGNELVIVVVRFSDGSYLEDQDHWWLAGLHRSVELRRRPWGADMMDYVVQADDTGLLSVQVDMRPTLSPTVQRRLDIALYADECASADGQVVRLGNSMVIQHAKIESLTQQVHFREVVSNVRCWTAETPHLYTLVISIRQNDAVTQVESCRVGFRTVAIVAPGVLTVNRRRITVCGMNRHEHDPDHGKVVSIERMKQDICLLKQNNFNAVRCSHYPCHSAFYRLCDFYGLYVTDEANIETHGMKPMGRLAHDPAWKRAFSSRITRMVRRDRNHACIIVWSLGNEAGRGRNLRAARKEVVELDPARPVVYESGGKVAEGTGRTELTDVICTMYPNVPRTVRLAQRKDEDRPVILCEYSHAMGNSNGNLHYYWDEFWSQDTPRLQGGYIWDMIDQGVRVRDPGHPCGEIFAYGGDFSDKVHDLNFCINGMFSPDRHPHPAVTEIKYLQQPVSIRPMDLSREDQLSVCVGYHSKAEVELRFENRYTFSDIASLQWSWTLTSDRSTDPVRMSDFTIPVGMKGPFEVTIPLDTVMSRVVDIEKSCKEGRPRFFLSICAKLRNNESWAKAGHALVQQQFAVIFAYQEPIETNPTAKNSEATLDLTADEANMIIGRIINGRVQSFVMIEKQSGTLWWLSPDGDKNVLAKGIQPWFTRASTDNDKGGVELTLDFIFPALPSVDIYRSIGGHAHFSHWSNWRRFGFDSACPPEIRCNKYSVPDIGSGQRLDLIFFCKAHNARNNAVLLDVTVTYSLFASGNIRMSSRVTPHRYINLLPSLPRVGTRLELIDSLYSIQYFGRGPGENYPDRKVGSTFGVYNTTAAEMGYLDYVVPSENGSRSDCEWIAFKGKDGSGICIVADNIGDPFSCSGLLYGDEELDKATHTLGRRTNGDHVVTVHIDHKLMGVGGDTSWYPVVYPEFIVSSTKEYNYTFWILPLTRADDAAQIARKVS